MEGAFTGVGVPYTYMTDPDLCDEKRTENKQNTQELNSGIFKTCQIIQ